jgi:hypothetical protein
MRIRATHTCAMLEVSPSTYGEIRAKLVAADYGHTLHTSRGDREWIDLTQIGLQMDMTPPVKQLAGSKPLIMYFRNEKDRDEFVALIRAERPDMAEMVTA